MKQTKDADPVDPSQLEFIKQLNDPLAGGMMANRTAGLIKEGQEKRTTW